MNSKETRRPGSRRTKKVLTRHTNARQDAGAQGEGRKRRRRRAATLSPYGSLACELLRLKEEFLKRNEQYRAEVQVLCDELPVPVSGGKNWKTSHWKRLRDFVLRWDTALLFPEELREHPYAAHRVIWDEAYGVVHLSPHESNLVVIGIDVRHDPEEIGRWVCQLVRDVRRHRETNGDAPERWKAMRASGVSSAWVFGEPLDTSSVTRMGRVHYWRGGLPQVGEEALLAWDWQRAGVRLEEIRNRLYPDAADLPPDHPRAGLVKDERDSESALRKTRRRLAEAARLIEKEGYRHVLPLTGTRSRLEAIRQWGESSGYAPEVRTRKGGQVRVRTSKRQK